jgi:hypothetical protein
MKDEGSQVPPAHQCEGMRRAVLSEDPVVIYQPAYREYLIPVRDGGASGILISFCPYCGAHLGESLRDAWFDALDAIGRDPDDDVLPDEFRSDRWWRDRSGE